LEPQPPGTLRASNGISLPLPLPAELKLMAGAKTKTRKKNCVVAM
jgi:hypothetical protein